LDFPHLYCIRHGTNESFYDCRNLKEIAVKLPDHLDHEHTVGMHEFYNSVGLFQPSAKTVLELYVLTAKNVPPVVMT
jgi:hypothetical protein